MNWKTILAGIVAIIIILLAILAFSNVLILAQDDTEGSIPGVDMECSRRI